LSDSDELSDFTERWSDASTEEGSEELRQQVPRMVSEGDERPSPFPARVDLHPGRWPRAPVIANVAIARELAGLCWSLAVMDP
jgi:hypothetical protein